MITRGIVEQVIDLYSVKVRIPLINKSAYANNNTPTSDLPEARICTLPRLDLNIQAGDIVFIAFENNEIGKPVILGYLYHDTFSTTASNLTLNSLNVLYDTYLSSHTHIGEVTPTELTYLTGLSDNIQKQLNLINDRLDRLEAKLES